MKVFPCAIRMGLVVLLCSVSDGPAAEDLPDFGPGDIVVTDHGARGDGKTDTTQALQRIAESLEKHPGFFVQKNWGAHSSMGSYPRVIFPAGEYLISDSIIWPKWITIVGRGKVVIRQSDSTKDAFYFHWGWRVRLFNLQFEGGKRQVKVWGNDTDGVLLIANCRFSGATEWAIENVMFERGGDTESAGGYVRDAEGKLRDIGNPEKSFFFNSTLMNIVGSTFENCRGVLRSNTDWTRLDQSRIIAGDFLGETAIRNHCMLQIRNVLFEFTGREAGGRSWIEQHKGQLTISDVVTKGNEAGAMPLVANKVRFHIPRPTGTQNSIAIDRGTFNLGRRGTVPLVRCDEFPNLIAVSNCVSSFGRAPAVGFPHDAILHELPDSPNFLVKLVFGPGNKNFSTEVPAVLAPFVYESDGLQDPKWKWPGLPEEGGALAREIEWMQVGGTAVVPPPNLTDHTAWLQMVVDQAAKRPAGAALPRLVLAPGVYSLNGTVKIPPRFRLEVAGQALFKITEPGSPALSIVNPQEVSVSSIMFEGGTNVASISAGEPGAGRVEFFYCFFMYGQGSAIRAKATFPNPDPGRLPSLVADHCYFGGGFTFVVSDFPTLLESSYVATRVLEPSPDHGFSGAVFWMNAPLVMRNLLMVPVVKTREVDYAWVVTRDGRVDMDWIRIGGEYGGISAIKVLEGAPHAKVALRNTWMYTFINPFTRSSLHFARTPEQIVAVNNTGGPELGPEDRVFIRLAPGVKEPGEPEKWFSRHANTFPTRVAHGEQMIPVEMELNP